MKVRHKSETLTLAAMKTPEAFTYDDDGNLLSDGRFSYTWNAENRLIQVSNFQFQVSFKYDHLGRRISKTVNGAETTFLWDGWNVIREASTSQTNSYVWGLDLSGSLQGAGGVGGLVSASLSGTNVYYACDGNGNVSDLVDTSGNVVAHYEYDSFGNPLVGTGVAANSNPWRFSSKYWEPETGLLHYELRPYMSLLGCWLSKDPIEENGGLNLYGFVGNNPVDLYDPVGLDFIALAARPLDLLFLDPDGVGLGFLNHLSVEYWESKCDAGINVEYNTQDFVQRTKGRGVGANIVAAVELMADQRWAIWEHQVVLDAGLEALPRHVWYIKNISISVIREDSDGIRFAAFFEPQHDNKRAVHAMWNHILSNARSYRWAEHNAPHSAARIFLGNSFRNWPNSLYQRPPGNNSNSFGRDMVLQVGQQVPNLRGVFPGRPRPHNIQNRWGNQIPFFRGQNPPPPHP